jgi:hypothetical protein
MSQSRRARSWPRSAHLLIAAAVCSACLGLDAAPALAQPTASASLTRDSSSDPSGKTLTLTVTVTSGTVFDLTLTLNGAFQISDITPSGTCTAGLVSTLMCNFAPAGVPAGQTITVTFTAGPAVPAYNGGTLQVCDNSGCTNSSVSGPSSAPPGPPNAQLTQAINELAGAEGRIRLEMKQNAHAFWLEMQRYADEGGLLRYIPGYSKLKKGIDALGKFASTSDLDTFKGLFAKQLIPVAAKKLGAVISIVGDLSSTCYLAMGAGAEFAAQDPPAQEFESVAQPKLPPGVHITSRERRYRPVAAAVNALVANTTQFSAQSSAFLTAYERFQGAVAANASAAVKAQASAAAGFAQAEAQLLRERPQLRSTLARVLRRAIGGRFEITARGRLLLARALATRGRTTQLVAYMEHLGIDPATSGADVKELRKRISGGEPKQPIVFPDFIASASAAKADSALAASMSNMAAKLTAVAGQL